MTQQKPQYQNTPYIPPKVPAWLKKAVTPWVKLNKLYQAFFDRSFKGFELLAKPFFSAAAAMDQMAKKPGACISLVLFGVLLYAVKSHGVL